jgi:hypothetical protein
LRLATLAALFFLTACGPKTIDSGELRRIFKEAFLVNAYYDTNRRVWLDTLDMYGPILARHGYDVDDLKHTINNFSRKKSSKLSDVVERAIEELKQESAYYDRRLAMIDTLYTIATQTLRREVLWRDSIVVRRVADTAKLHITIPVMEGLYELSYSYLVDTLDKNPSLRTTMDLLDSAGVRLARESEYVAIRGTHRKSGARSLRADTTATELEIIIGNYPQKELKRPYIRVDSLRVIYYMPRERALDSVSSRWNDIWKYDYKTHSGALRPLPPRVDTLAVGGGR